MILNPSFLKNLDLLKLKQLRLIIATLFPILFVLMPSKSLATGITQCHSILSQKQPRDEIKLHALSAGPRITRYLEAVKNIVYERNDLLDIFLRALVAKEHVLLTGVPGNAKTMLTKYFFGGIKHRSDQQPSLFATQMTAETSLSDTHGGVNYRVLNETGRQERLYDECKILDFA